MPRLKKATTERQYDRIRAVIQYYQGLNKYTREELALVTHMSLTTWWSRMNNPQNFTVEELTRLSRKFGIPVKTFFEEVIL